MSKIHSRPLGVLLISGAYLLGAVILVFMYITNPTDVAIQIATRHGLVETTGNWIIPAIAGLGFLIAIGLLTLSRWGYIITMIYLIYFCIFNIYSAIGEVSTVNLGNAIFTALVIIYLLLMQKKFCHQ